MAYEEYEESNGHVTDDVTWPPKGQVVTPISLESNIAAGPI